MTGLHVQHVIHHLTRENMEEMERNKETNRELEIERNRKAPMGGKGRKKWRDQVGERQERDTIKCKINLEEEMFLWL